MGDASSRLRELEEHGWTEAKRQERDPHRFAERGGHARLIAERSLEVAFLPLEQMNDSRVTSVLLRVERQEHVSEEVLYGFSLSESSLSDITFAGRYDRLPANSDCSRHDREEGDDHSGHDCAVPSCEFSQLIERRWRLSHDRLVA